MATPLIYLPGFNSGPQSEKSSQLQLAFPGLLAATYNTWDPDAGFHQLDALIKPLLADKPLLIGSSLGGFWAYHLAAQYGLGCLLINPCMTPELSLSYAVGKVQNFYTGETGWLAPEHLLAYPHYRQSNYPICTVLHEKGDELIPYQESIANFKDRPNSKLILLEGGNHRFTHMEVLFEEIRAMLHRE